MKHDLITPIQYLTSNFKPAKTIGLKCMVAISQAMVTSTVEAARVVLIGIQTVNDKNEYEVVGTP